MLRTAPPHSQVVSRSPTVRSGLERNGHRQHSARSGDSFQLLLCARCDFERNSLLRRGAKRQPRFSLTPSLFLAAYPRDPAPGWEAARPPGDHTWGLLRLTAPARLPRRRRCQECGALPTKLASELYSQLGAPDVTEQR